LTDQRVVEKMPAQFPAGYRTSAKLFQTSSPPDYVQLATSYLELNGERLGAPPDFAEEYSLWGSP
jgi:hypothetical protein